MSDRAAPERSSIPKEPDLSLGALVRELTESLGTLLRQEVELARVETREELGKAARALAALAVAGVAALLALLLLSLALTTLLDEGMPTGLAFTLVGLAWAIAAGAMYAAGRRRLHDVDPMLRQTMETLKEDVEWARTQTS